MKANHPSNVRSCCREAFNYWLKHNVDASWEILLQALESDSVGERTLAEDIRKKLLSGKVMKFVMKKCSYCLHGDTYMYVFCYRRY